MAKWLPPNGFTGKVHHLEAKKGGTYKMSFTNFNTGKGHSFGGTYLELKPNELIRHTDKFDDANLPGEMVATISLKPVSCGTELKHQFSSLCFISGSMPSSQPVSRLPMYSPRCLKRSLHCATRRFNPHFSGLNLKVKRAPAAR